MNKKFFLLGLPVVCLLTMANSGCDDQSPADTAARRAQALVELQGVQSVGMPAITNFAEKKLLKEVYELRDKSQPTIAYIPDLNGHLHKLCDAVGYGIPYATQYTNPAKTIEGHGDGEFVAIPQADPNGLFSPANADGTWVACVNPVTKEAAVIFVEPRVIVSPFPLDVK
jgi:hypothetical protein